MNISRIKRLGRRAWQEQDGVLTFEWVLLVTLLAIGIVGGVSSVRDAIISELGDVAQALVRVDQSYTVNPFGDPNNLPDDCPVFAPGWECPDEPDEVTVCRPTDPPITQTAVDTSDISN